MRGWSVVADSVVLLLAAWLQASLILGGVEALLSEPSTGARARFDLQPPAGVPGEAAAVFLWTQSLDSRFPERPLSPVAVSASHR